MPEAEKNSGMVRFPFQWQHCPFCWGAIHEQRIVTVGEKRFRYENDCSCLAYALGVAEADGSYYWEVIEHKHQSTSQEFQRNWEHWQHSITDASPTTDDSPSDDTWLYEEGRILMNSAG